MIFDHVVKHNGRYYNPGDEVPVNEEPLFLEEPSDADIVMDTDAVAKPRSSSKRGRPKKSE